MDKILFSGPWVKRPGLLPFRVVLHANIQEGVPVEYIVHNQLRLDGGKECYDSGSYFPLHAYGEKALPSAMAKFWERCLGKYRSLEGLE